MINEISTIRLSDGFDEESTNINTKYDNLLTTFTDLRHDAPHRRSQKRYQRSVTMRDGGDHRKVHGREHRTNRRRTRVRMCTLFFIIVLYIH